MMRNESPLQWLAPGQDFPPTAIAWGQDTDAPGLLAAGGTINAHWLRRAYSRGIFPWYSAGQPTLWWTPDPRMVLFVDQFKVSRSFKKTLRRFQQDAQCEIRFDSCFKTVMQFCAMNPRKGQSGTWIQPEMINAYAELHRQGFAHSVETWVNGALVGGLYCVSLGKAVFGESMFSLQPEASKIALAALVAFCRRQGIPMVDCQQNTAHLASLGAHEVSRQHFEAEIAANQLQAPPHWHFEPLYWQEILPPG